MSSKARKNRTVGEIVNHISVDAQRLLDLVTYLYAIYTAPLQIALALGLLYRFMGPSVFAGFGVMVLIIPFNILAAKWGKKYQVSIHLHTLHYPHPIPYSLLNFLPHLSYPILSSPPPLLPPHFPLLPPLLTPLPPLLSPPPSSFLPPLPLHSFPLSLSLHLFPPSPLLHPHPFLPPLPLPPPI